MDSITSVEFGDIWSGEFDENMFYSIYALNENSFEQTLAVPITFRDIAMQQAIGFYFPQKGRTFYSDSIDIRNDGRPNFGNLSGFGGFFREISGSLFQSCSFFRIHYLPKSVRSINGIHFKVLFMMLTNETKYLISDYVTLNPENGNIVPCFHK